MSQNSVKNLVRKAIFESAREHGSMDDPDHEVGDLQDYLLELLTGFLSVEESRGLLRPGTVGGGLVAKYLPKSDIGLQDDDVETEHERIWMALIGAAQKHGERDDPDHEVGDLQDIITDLFDRFLDDAKALRMVEDESSTIAEMIDDYVGLEGLMEEIEELSSQS